MCECGNDHFEVRDGKLYGEYDGDLHEYSKDQYSYCPICGEHLYQMTEKRFIAINYVVDNEHNIRLIHNVVNVLLQFMKENCADSLEFKIYSGRGPRDCYGIWLEFESKKKGV